jgi:hypothetical protein
MKIERSCRCLTFRLAAVVAAVGSVAFSLANQGSTRARNALPANIILELVSKVSIRGEEIDFEHTIFCTCTFCSGSVERLECGTFHS